MIKLEKICVFTAKNFHNLDTYQIIEILLVLRNTHTVSNNQDQFMYYVKNYIDWNQFNKLYNHDQIKKRQKKCKRNYL